MVSKIEMKHMYKVLGWGLILLMTDFVLLEFFPNRFFQVFLESITLLLLIAAILTVKSFGKWVSITLIVSGIIIYLLNHVALTDMLKGVAYNVGIIGIMLAVPVIGIAIHTGGYLEAIRNNTHIQRMKGRSHPYAIAQILIMVLAPFLSVGATQIVFELAHKSLDRFYSKRMGMVLYRGFASSLYWSPFASMLILATDLFHVAWSSILGYLLIGFVCHVVAALVSFKFTSFANDEWIEQPDNSEVMDEKQVKRKIISLIMIMCGLIVLAVLLETFTKISIFVIIIVLSFSYSLVWMAMLGKLKDFACKTNQYVNQAFFQVRNEILLFISAGFFASAVSKSPINHFILNVFSQIMSLPTLIFILILFSVFILAGLIGIHCVVPLTIIGTSIDASAYGWNPYFLATAITFAVVLYNQTSPFSAISIITSNLIQSNNAVVFKKNLLFTCLLFIFLALAIWLIGIRIL